MTPLKVILVDDEPLARLRLRALLQDCADPACEVTGEAGDAAAAQMLLRQQPCDLLLLDIGLPGLDGLQLAATLQAMAQPPGVVFVTAHAEHAVRAFELDAVDYLTKPVTRERLRSALQRAAQRRRAAEPAPQAADAARVLVVHDRGRVLRVPLADILYLKAELKYVTLRTARARLRARRRAQHRAAPRRRLPARAPHGLVARSAVRARAPPRRRRRRGPCRALGGAAGTHRRMAGRVAAPAGRRTRGTEQLLTPGFSRCCAAPRRCR